jgi:hypothetical protein
MNQAYVAQRELPNLYHVVTRDIDNYQPVQTAVAAFLVVHTSNENNISQKTRYHH